MSSQPTLIRSISLPLLVFYGLGNILGAGIYVLVGKVAGIAGFWAPLSFVVASLIVAASVFTYAELSARYPVSAGESVYIFEGFGIRSLATVVGLLLVVAGCVSSAAIAHGFVGYLNELVPVSSSLGLVLLVSALFSIAAWGILQSVTIAALLTVIEIVGLVLVVWAGRAHLGSAAESFQLAQNSLGEVGIVAVFSGAFLAFYAYIGFEDMVNIAEEVKQPRRNMPRAIIISLVVSTLIYVVVSLTSVLVVQPSELANSDAPLSLIYSTAGNSDSAFLITVISLFAVVNGALIQIIMSARVLYGLANKGWLPAWLGQVSATTHTPVIATLLVSVAVLLAAVSLPMLDLAQMTSALILTIFVLVNLALYRIKRKDPQPDGIRIYPIWVPLLGATVSAGMLLFKWIV
ncbi:MAG: amino acid permease [Pseudomonadales bacterium]|nr:amino acid permease [Pseudomonadales bacterium]